MLDQESASTQDRLLRVLIVDDMPQVRQELRVLLQLTGELEVVGEAANAAEAISQAGALHPDVVVMDLEMPGPDGCEATRQIKERRLAEKVIMWSVHASLDDVRRAHQSGVDVFIDKGTRYETLMSAILASRPSIQANMSGKS
jgi:DNA-binding NarL/FixJ family response regulator